ncbi:MAG: DEAD/DEAH box helicase family protein, partial [Candidatus Subteraquimicrobiales bacterium]|nr:DEAD/DEAH box helicase family protein [Candidatus Subteraquimicrobiales bacterium]
MFFVNTTNIIEKTKANFLNIASSKYLFSENINIDGEFVSIKEVDSFQGVDENVINICFTTIQGLHSDLWMPRENGLTINDFEDKKIVLISDEAHHINSDTKKGKKSKDEEINEQSWEYSVTRIFGANKNNIMLEFTATCDLKNPFVGKKYLDKIIFDYPLSKFRENKYTKELKNFQSDFGKWERTLQAMLLSQYRLKLFQRNGLNIKPVILLKSQYIDESKDFYTAFHLTLKKINGSHIADIDKTGDPIIEKMFEFFHNNNITYDLIADELTQEFAEEKCILMNDSKDDTSAKQLLLNSLEDLNNPYRLIFTVDKLTEGWDVLNLFDIVRLYETRQSGGKSISPYTIKEAQLIG